MVTVSEATDLDTARHILSGAYGNVRLSSRGEQHLLRLRQQWLGQVRLDHLTYRMDLEADLPPLGALAFGQLIAGSVSHDSGGDERRYRPGDVFFGVQRDQPLRLAIHDSEAELAIIGPPLVDQVAATEPTRAPRPVRFVGYDPVTPAAAETWRHAYAYVRDILRADPAKDAYPLLMGGAGRWLVAVTLATFPNTALTDPTVEDRHDASPTTLRRAVAFIDDHPHLDISVADIAAAAYVTIRGVQLAFRRHLGTTPTAYLRRVRLQHAHRELVDADPRTTTVADVAARWGFASCSRFITAYRTAFGITPGRTLRG